MIRSIGAAGGRATAITVLEGIPRGFRFGLAALMLTLVPVVAFGADAVVTDIQGNRLELRNVQMAYEYEPLSPFRLYRIGEAPPRTPIFQATGLKVFQGDAQVTIEWGKIQKLVIRRGPDANRIGAEVTLRVAGASPPVTVELVKPVAQMIGSISYGRFSIDLGGVASIEPIPTASAENSPKTSKEEFQVSGLSVTDRKGVSMDIKGNSTETPWVSLGAGSVTIPFSRIAKLEITPGASNGPSTMAIDIDGQGRLKFPFAPDGQLQGESALGSYAILWNQVAAISVHREKVVAK